MCRRITHNGARHGSVQENAQNMYAAVLQHGSVQENAQIMHAAVLQDGGVNEKGLQHLIQITEDEADAVVEDVVVQGRGRVFRFVVQ